MKRPHESPECRCDGCEAFDGEVIVRGVFAHMFQNFAKVVELAYRETPSAYADLPPLDPNDPTSTPCREEVVAAMGRNMLYDTPQEPAPVSPDAPSAVQAGADAPAGRLGAGRA